MAGGSALMGMLGGRSKAKAQERFAKESAAPKPYEEHVTRGPAAWLEPYLKDTMSGAWGAMGNRPVAPLLSDVSRFQSAWRPGGGAVGFGGGKGPPVPMIEGSDGSFKPAPIGRFTRDHFDRKEERLGGGRSGMSGMGGMGGRGGGRDGGAGGLQNLLLQRASTEDPRISQAMSSLSPFMGGAHMNPAIALQQQIAGRQMGPNSPLRRLIGMGMGGFGGRGPGLNAASQPYGQFVSGLMDRFNSGAGMLAPPPTYSHLNFFTG
jgi:hypothetical protein